jgi:tetratricopeptide (TPR) repeat protein
MIGQQVKQFRIVEKLGAGGMGEVYVAEDTRLKRRVALKFLPPHYSADPEFKARFEHEATAAAALNHPNIVTVYELGDHEGRLFIALELVEGQSLEQMIEAGDVRISTAVKIAQQAAEGLAAAHEAGIVHRDIKPANILVDKSGRVKILDFGLAKSRRATTETKVGTTVGTIQYESPEQGRGDAVDQRSDLFSLGVVLYELVTGKRPFAGEFTDAIRYAIANDTPEPLARYKADVPDDLQRIVSKLLEKDPDLRYQTAGGLQSDLKLLQRSSGPTPSSVHSSYHSAVGGPAGPPKGRKLGRVIVPAAAIVIAAVLLLVFKPWKVDIQTTQEAAAGEDRLAVMYFDNLSDPADAQRQGEVVASLLISDLSESKYMQVVSTQRLYDILKNMGKEGTRKITPDIATEVARKANARWMLTGRILSPGPDWVVSAELSDVKTGDLISSPSITGQSGERIFEVVDRLTHQIKQQLALPAEALAEIDKPVVELTTGSSDAYRLYLEAEELRNRFLMAEAEQKYREALKDDSTFAMAYAGIAFCRNTYWHDYIGAQEAFRRAFAFVDHTTDHDGLYIRAMHAIYEGQSQEGLSFLQSLAKQYPDDKEAFQALGQQYQYNVDVQDLQKAVDMYRHAVELDPTWPIPYNALAYAYEELGDFEQSLWAINKYIELSPSDPNPYDSRAELMARNGQLDQALASYLKALDFKSDFVPSLSGAIGLYVHAQKYDEAQKLITRMLQHSNPDVQSRGRSEAVGMAVHRGHFKEALRLLGEQARADSAHGETRASAAYAHTYRAYLYGVLDQPDKALAELEPARRLFAMTAAPEFVERSMHDVLTGMLIWLHRLDGIDSLLQESAAAIGQPGAADSSGYWNMVGNARFAAGAYDSAIAYYERGAGRRLTFEEHIQLGRAHAGARHFRDAQRYFDEADGIFDDSRRNNTYWAVLYYYWSAQVYDKSGKGPEAITNYRKFLDIWKDADPGIKEIADAKARLAALGA